MYVFGYTLNMDEAITDLFYRNILFDKIFTKNVRFINRLKKLFNYKIMIDNDHYRVCQRNIRRTLFSGGCFWCMAHPYYTFDGVIKVLSGYAGGTSLNPTYLETKKGNGYLETVLIVYDSNKISYSDLLKLYFESIDPFDTEGQFIDKGYSYTTQVYLKTKNEINCFEEYKKKIEDLYKMKVSVKKHGDALFYVAEDEHQEFEFKNKEKFLKEEEDSGRNNFSYVKI
jgi:methionine-S-sulfoxide reductase